ncbi:LysE family translocator [Parasalinivibrio latis]|uniref:LysE family translocator n=1 Tax=Parasalinivibrio latis TaxID=2952610 RepID=UPI0030E2A0A0
MAFDIWLLFLTAAVGIAFVPGPNSLLALTHGALYGHKRTLYTICGGVIGLVVLALASMAGIGAILAASAHALTFMRWIGGAYLIWLGFQLWRSPGLQLEHNQTVQVKRGRSMFSQGLLAALTNPKAMLFFAAFLPQFLRSDQPLLPQFVIMALTIAVVELSVEYMVAVVAFKIRPWLARSGKGFNRTCGGIFALIGAALPLSR